jgi:Protein of unknown function (DUF992)
VTDTRKQPERKLLVMFKHRAMLMTIAALAAVASPASAQAPGVMVGSLNCLLSPTIGLFVGSVQTISCRFVPNGPYPQEAYVGSIGTLGLDIGIVAGGVLGWAVYNQSASPLINALAGTYVGPSGQIGVGVGVGANILFGGSASSIALQPISVEGEVAVNLELGISSLTLRPAY